MFKKNILKQKTANLIAVFFIFTAINLEAKPASENLEVLKKKVNSQLLNKQKNKALLSIQEFIKSETNKSIVAESSELMVLISQTFMAKETQDAYEASVNSTLTNISEAKRQADECLALDPQNTNCLIQKLKLVWREKNKNEIEKNWILLDELTKGSKINSWLDLAIHKEDFDFKNKSIIKKLNEKPSEDFFILVVLELERAFLAKNFSRARECVEYLDKNFPDYPEIIYFKQKIDTESTEDKPSNINDINLMYSTKCKNLTKSLARKFRYDFDLCARGAL